MLRRHSMICKKNVELWTTGLIDIAEHLSSQLTVMKIDIYIFMADEHELPSARLNLFFQNLIKALEKHHGRATNFASESRKFCHDVLFKVLVKIVCHNPRVDLLKAFKSLPKDADIREVEELVGPIADRVSHVPRTKVHRKN